TSFPTRRSSDLGDGLQNPKDDTPDPFADEVPKHEPGAMRALVLPFVMLIVGVVAAMYVSGGILGESWGILDTLAAADVAIALNVGGIAALLIAAYYCIRYTKGNAEFTAGTKRSGTGHGAISMVPP